MASDIERVTAIRREAERLAAIVNDDLSARDKISALAKAAALVPETCPVCFPNYDLTGKPCRACSNN